MRRTRERSSPLTAASRQLGQLKGLPRLDREVREYGVNASLVVCVIWDVEFLADVVDDGFSAATCRIAPARCRLSSTRSLRS